jgi:KipI family sensor histidine kinase inhibitor
MNAEDDRPMRILPVNDAAVLVELADLAETLALFDALQREPIAGVTSLVPAARTILVQFAPWAITPTQLAAQIGQRDRHPRARPPGALVELPVRYDGEDLAEVAEHLGLTPAQLVARHTGREWDVAFTGFAPGFAYLTGGDPVFDVPRRASPRTRIPAGAVALAGRYSGIYPRESPGGWQLIGRTDEPMWDLARDPPARLQPGQRVRFVDVATEAGAALQDRLAAGDAADDHPALQVLTTGLQALFQDLGRAGQAGQGVSASGALDRRTFKAANRLVGNAPGATAIEIVDGGFTVRALQAVVVAVTGAVGPLTRESPARQADAAQGARVRETVPRGAPLALDAGDVLAVGAAQAGLRSYLAVRGGLAVAPVLGSCATDTLSAVGPAPIRAGQYLSVSFQGTTESVSYPEESCVALPTPGEPVTLDLTIGPRAEWFGPEAFALLQSQDWTVSAQSNRVGLRLRGDAPLQRRPEWRTAELASEGMVPGVLQVPPDGQPVLFLADHPLTGGYPVIACVATHHIDLAGQLPVGARVRFRLSSAPT